MALTRLKGLLLVGVVALAAVGVAVLACGGSEGDDGREGQDGSANSTDDADRFAGKWQTTGGWLSSACNGAEAVRVALDSGEEATTVRLASGEVELRQPEFCALRFAVAGGAATLVPGQPCEAEQSEGEPQGQSTIQGGSFAPSNDGSSTSLTLAFRSVSTRQDGSETACDVELIAELKRTD